MSSKNICKDMSGQYLLYLEGDASISRSFKGWHEKDLIAATQELSELNKETRHIFDSEKEDKKIICTNKIKDLTAKIATLDEQLASLDEQIQRWKEENKPRPQSEFAECEARSKAHMRARLERIR